MTTEPDTRWTVCNVFEQPERQARIIDISRYWRTGGIDWSLLKGNFDAVIIAAGVGFKSDVLLLEHTEKAVEHDVPYATFHIPDPAMDMAEQAHFYSELPEVKTHKVFGDWEPPYKGSREPDQVEFLYYLIALDGYTEQEAGVYSRIEIIKRMGSPDYLKKRDLWLAQYIYEIYTEAKKVKYRKFEPWLERYAWKLLPAVIGTGLEENVKIQQFTDFGDARFYCANRITADPKNVYGMTSADLNVSVGEYREFMKWFVMGAVVPEPPPEPEPTGCNAFMAQVAAVVDKWRETE